MKPSKKNSGRKKSKSAPNNPKNPQSQQVPPPISNSIPESRARDLAWLSDAFSSISMSQIESIYDETGHDAFKAAGILGSQLEIEEEKLSIGSTFSEASSWDPSSSSSFYPSSNSSSSDPGVKPTVFEGSPSRRKGKKVRPKNIAMSCGMVSNVIGKGYVGNSKERGMDRRFEEDEGFLRSILGDGSELGIDVIRDILDQCGGDLEKALEALLELSDSSYKINERNFANNSRNILDYSIIFGGEKNPNSHKLSDKASSFKYEYDRPDMQKKVLESLFNVHEMPKYEPERMDWRKIAKKLQSTGEDSHLHQNPKNGKGDGYHEFRTVAQRNWETMKEYYHKAALEYTRGNRSHASVLAEKGKHYRDLARQEDEKASLEIFGARNREIKNIVTIDLHGQHVKQAIGLLKRHLLLFACVPSVHNLRVITGCGLDGVGKGKLKRSVIGLVEREGLKWTEENGGTIMLNIHGHKVYSFVDSDSDSEL